jgi:hypothetical protein
MNTNLKLKRTIIQGPWEGSKISIFVMLLECNENFLEDGKLSICLYACICVGVYEELYRRIIVCILNVINDRLSMDLIIKNEI